MIGNAVPPMFFYKLAQSVIRYLKQYEARSGKHSALSGLAKRAVDPAIEVASLAMLAKAGGVIELPLKLFETRLGLPKDWIAFLAALRTSASTDGLDPYPACLHVRRVHAKYGENVSKAAAALKITRNTLRKYL